MHFPTIVKYSMNSQDQIDNERSCNREAVARKLPTLLVEIGQNGSRDKTDVEAIVSGIGRIMEVPYFDGVFFKKFMVQVATLSLVMYAAIFSMC